MYHPQYALFFDFHTQLECPDVGADFNAEAFTDQIISCGADYLVFHARCNVGNAYYNTQTGTRHPSLKYDLFGELAECCRRKGIHLAAYLNGGISSSEGLAHRDWTTLAFDGKEYLDDRTSPFLRTMCYNSPYRAHIIAMIEEIALNYPVEGFFVDCILPYKCICPLCVSLMKEQKTDYNNEAEVELFARKSMLSFCHDIKLAVAKHIKDPLIFFNSNNQFEAATDNNTYLECECLPTAQWGYETLPVMARYIRTVKRGVPVLNMTGRFYDWGDFGGLRGKTSLLYDLFYGMANGMRPNIGGHLHPRGVLENAVCERIKEVYGELKKYDEYFKDAENSVDCAIVFSDEHDKDIYLKPLYGAVRMLEELKYQFDIVTAQSEWENYKILVIPEKIPLSVKLSAKIRAHIAAGKGVFACGANAAVAFGKEFGVELLHENCNYDPVYFSAETDGSPAMPLSVYAECCSVVSTEAAPLAYIVKPYYNTAWNGHYAICYNPPQEVTGYPFLLRNGNCIFCSGGLFSGYYKRGADHLRNVFANSMKALLPYPLIKYENLYSFTKLFVCSQEDRILIHILNFVPEARGETFVVEDAVTLKNAKLFVRTDGCKIASVFCLPVNAPIPHECHDNYCIFNTPLINGYGLIVLQKDVQDIKK